jgi:predicted metal-dependent hydrolase
MPTISLQGREISYSVVKERAKRYTYLRFGDGAVLEVVAPNPKSIDVVQVLRERQSWVLKHFDELSKSKRVLSPETVMFDGRQLKLVFEKTDGREALGPDLDGGRLVVAASDRARVRELVRRWFLRESSAYVVRSLPRLAAGLGVTYRRADVREIKNWGYCTKDGRLSFSWQLIALPEHVREYVLFHELVHLLEHNHSRAFRRRLASVMPDFREREKALGMVIPL